jgi:uncharacterized phage-associated protein
MAMMVLPHDARAVANYFLEKAQSEGRAIDPMGIQKLVYFAHGWSLALYGRPLISQPIEAWEYGPVIKDLYGQFKQFGYAPITSRASIWTMEPGTRRFGVSQALIPESDTETRSLLDRVWEVYKNFTSIQLSNLTHVPESPWKQARDQGSRIIDNDLIRQYFTAQMNGPH